MENINLELVKKVISLSKRRRTNYNYQGGHISERTPQTEEYKKAKEELESFMHTLAFEEIKYLQTIMYLGRDTTEAELDRYTGNELYQQQYNSLVWENKNVETRQMTGKMPLDEYLQKGLDILRK